MAIIRSIKTDTIKEAKVQQRSTKGFKIKKKGGGLRLWYMDINTYVVHEARIKKSEVFHLTKEVQSKYEMTVPNGFPFLWSLNRANAIKKFQKKVNEWFKQSRKVY